ncbi:MAG: hypothetical protein LBU96_05525 [Yokenella regensburgei]|nr:hypothetical protein [Yokenella regensburgei]
MNRFLMRVISSLYNQGYIEVGDDFAIWVAGAGASGEWVNRIYRISPPVAGKTRKLQ